MRTYLDLTKSGIVAFVLVSGLAGYALSWPPAQAIDFTHLILTILSLYFFSSGSFAINQAQEWHIDVKMPRTQKRPIPSGKVTPAQAYALGTVMVLLGVCCGFLVSELVVWLGLATVILYNVLYTLWWKRKLAFGAVPGAIPGAMPVVVGYAANTDFIFRPEIIHAFMLMFLWQMPHFWALAIRFKDDYAAGGIPVLPVKLGVPATLFQMGLYMFAYVGLAIATPYFTAFYWAYLILVLPFAFKVFWEFFRYFKSDGKERWLSFFLWTNFSILIFLVAPVIDKWHRYFSAVM